MLFMLFRNIKRCLFSLKGAKTQMMFALLYCHDATSIYPKEKKKLLDTSGVVNWQQKSFLL